MSRTWGSERARRAEAGGMSCQYYTEDADMADMDIGGLYEVEAGAVGGIMLVGEWSLKAVAGWRLIVG